MPIQPLAWRISEAASEAGIGLTLLPVLYSYSGFGSQEPNHSQRRFVNTTDSYLDLLERLKPHLAIKRAQRLGICFHSLRAVSPEQINVVLNAVHLDQPIHIHIAEQLKEVSDCLAWAGRRPLQWLYENVSIDKHWCLVHATHANSNEIAAMAYSGAVAGLCLTTEANLETVYFRPLTISGRRALRNRVRQSRIAECG
jgi:formimidoylglutamate deiminase